MCYNAKNLRIQSHACQAKGSESSMGGTQQLSQGSQVFSTNVPAVENGFGTTFMASFVALRKVLL